MLQCPEGFRWHNEPRRGSRHNSMSPIILCTSCVCNESTLTARLLAACQARPQAMGLSPSIVLCGQ